MDIKPVKTKKDYEAALKAIEHLMGARRGSPGGGWLDAPAYDGHGVEASPRARDSR